MLQSFSTRAFKEAGFDEEQAGAMSEMMTEIFSAFATKQDLALSEERTGRRIEVLGSELRGEIETLRAEFDGRFSTMETGLDGRFSTMESILEKALKEQTWRFIALIVFISTLLGLIDYYAA